MSKSPRNRRAQARPAAARWPALTAMLGVLLTVPPVLAVSGVSSSAAAGTATSTTFVASADAHVRADRPRRNFGGAKTLRVDGSPETRTLLRFKVAGLSSAPRRATVKVFSRTTTRRNGVSLRRVRSSAWAEKRVTFRTAPRVGSAVDSSGSLTAGRWVSFDVTSVVQGNATYSFALTTRSRAARSFASRETARKPRLVIRGGTGPTVVAAAGDVACSPDDVGFNNGDGVADRCHMKATSELVQKMDPKAVFALGDLQYNNGSLDKFNASYDLSWGTFKNITRPVIGNHEYGTTGGAGYFRYFGDAATPRDPGCRSDCGGFYSFDIGAWHAVVLNSECAELNNGDGCVKGSPQQRWLERDLARSNAACTVALVHKPRWGSNVFVAPEIGPLVRTMYAEGVDLMLAGHAHSYERFAPQNPRGELDRRRGIREIVVGTGGAFFTGFKSTIEPNSVVHKDKIFGVLKLRLHADSYDWSFVADPATPFTDSGTGACH